MTGNIFSVVSGSGFGNILYLSGLQLFHLSLLVVVATEFERGCFESAWLRDCCVCAGCLDKVSFWAFIEAVNNSNTAPSMIAVFFISYALRGLNNPFASPL